MDRSEEFKRLTMEVRQIILDGFDRGQSKLYKKIAQILQINSMEITYKTLSVFKKVDTIDVLKKSKPIKFLDYIDIQQDGTVKFRANASYDLDTMTQNKLNRINTGEEHGLMIGTTVSNLIKNNPNIDINELIRTLQERC